MDLGVPVDIKLKMTQQCTFTANKVNAILASGKVLQIGWGKWFFSTQHSVRPHLEFCVQFWAPQYRSVMDIMERIIKMIKGLEHLCYEESLREVALFSLERGKLKGDLTNVYKYLKGGWKEYGDRSCPVTKQEVVETKWNTGSSLSASGNTLQWGRQSIGTGCPDRLQSFSSWQYSKAIWPQFWTSGQLRKVVLESGWLEQMTSRDPSQP